MLMYNVINQNYLAKRYLTLLLLIKSAEPLHTHTHTHTTMNCRGNNLPMYYWYFQILSWVFTNYCHGTGERSSVGRVLSQHAQSPEFHSLAQHKWLVMTRWGGRSKVILILHRRVAWATWKPLLKQTNKKSDFFSGLHWCCSCPSKWHPGQTTQEWYLRLNFILTSLKLWCLLQQCKPQSHQNSAHLNARPSQQVFASLGLPLTLQKQQHRATWSTAGSPLLVSPRQMRVTDVPPTLPSGTEWLL